MSVLLCLYTMSVFRFVAVVTLGNGYQVALGNNHRRIVGATGHPFSYPIPRHVSSVFFPRIRQPCDSFTSVELPLVKVDSTGSGTEWDMLGAGLDPARVRARNEHQGEQNPS